MVGGAGDEENVPGVLDGSAMSERCGGHKYSAGLPMLGRGSQRGGRKRGQPGNRPKQRRCDAKKRRRPVLTRAVAELGIEIGRRVCRKGRHLICHNSRPFLISFPQLPPSPRSPAFLTTLYDPARLPLFCLTSRLLPVHSRPIFNIFGAYLSSFPSLRGIVSTLHPSLSTCQ
ncbi:hypothetical protein FA95DRAFT_1140967 [Auriscalpium vulgare]|uniref:Uncharacterized protein n=1 Tax=Auriscalpium vulgare TaxID=40419 RepID=A0ACB8RVP3_9AGAM|nr:hypothetical protein FA95DRAFT_1140967 [Auriscalpium vulgare]